MVKTINMKVDAEWYDRFKAQCVAEGKGVYDTIQELIQRETIDDLFNGVHCPMCEIDLTLDLDYYDYTYCPYCGKRLL